MSWLPLLEPRLREGAILLSSEEPRPLKKWGVRVRRGPSGWRILRLCIPPGGFQLTHKSHPAFCPSLSIFNTKNVIFFEEPGRLGGAFVLL